MDPRKGLGTERRLRGQLGVKLGENWQFGPPEGRFA